MVEANSEDNMDEDTKLALDSVRIVQDPALELQEDKQNSLSDEAELDELTSEDARSLGDVPKGAGSLSFESDDEPMERRAFLRHRLVGSTDADQAKLKGKGSRTRFLGKGMRAKRRKKRTKPKQAAPKSSQTRQSSTSHIGVTTMASNEQSSAAISLANTLKQHLPSINLSSGMQKLIMTKLGSTGPASTLFKQQQQQQQMAAQESPQYIEASGQVQAQPVGSPADANLLIRHASGFIENPRLAEYPWPPGSMPSSMQSASEDNAAYFPSLGAEPNKVMLQPNKMIPVEIVGLDPVVASSILRDTTGSAQLLGEPQHVPEASSPPQSNPVLFPHQQQLGTRPVGEGDHMRSSAKSSSILHIHHFHHPGSRASSILGSNSVQRPSSPVAGPETEVHNGSNRGAVGENSHFEASEEPTRQVHNPKSNQMQREQTFVNDKGELVYLAMEEQAGSPPDSVADQQQPEKAEGDSESNQHAVDQNKGAWNHRGTHIGRPQQLAGLMSPNQASSELQQRIYLTKSGQPVNIIGMGKPPFLRDDKQRLLMVSYKPQLQNMTSVESESASRAPFNDGQESRPGLLSSKHILEGTSFVLNPAGQQAQYNSQSENQQQIVPVEQLNFIRSRLLASNSSNVSDPVDKPQAQSENRVPSKSTLVNESGLLTLVNNEAITKNGSAPFWSGSEVGSLNGYLDSKMASLKTTSESVPTGQRNNRLNSAELYKHLSSTLVDNQTGKLELPTANQASLGNSQSSKLTNQQLLRLLTDLRSTNSSALDQVLLAPNVSVVNQHPQLQQHEILRPVGKLALGQTLEDATRYTKLSDYFPVPPPQLSGPQSANTFETLEPHHAHHRNQKFKADSTGFRQDWTRGVGSTRHSNYSNTNAEEPVEFALSDSSGGVSNLAVTFIFIISLVTVALIAGKSQINMRTYH